MFEINRKNLVNLIFAHLYSRVNKIYQKFWACKKIVVVEEGERRLFNYHAILKSPFHLISFRARFEPPFLGLCSSLYNRLSKTLRKFLSHGFGKNKIYRETYQ